MNTGVKIDKVSRCKLSTLTTLWIRAHPATATPPASTSTTAARTSTSSARPVAGPRGLRGGGGGGRSTGGGSLYDPQCQAINFILSKSRPFVRLIRILNCQRWKSGRGTRLELISALPVPAPQLSNCPLDIVNRPPGRAEQKRYCSLGSSRLLFHLIQFSLVN